MAFGFRRWGYSVREEADKYRTAADDTDSDTVPYVVSLPIFLKMCVCLAVSVFSENFLYYSTVN